MIVIVNHLTMPAIICYTIAVRGRKYEYEIQILREYELRLGLHPFTNAKA